MLTKVWPSASHGLCRLHFPHPQNIDWARWPPRASSRSLHLNEHMLFHLQSLISWLNVPAFSHLVVVIWAISSFLHRQSLWFVSQQTRLPSGLYYFPLCQLPWWQKVSSLVWVLEPTYWGNWEGKGALWLAAPLDPQCSKVKKKTGSYQKDGVLDTGWAKAIYVSLTKIRCALLLSVSFSLSFCFSLLMLKLKH